MKKSVMFVLFLIIFAAPIFVSPAFAGGNLTVNFTSMAPAYVNVNQSYDMLKIYLNITPGTGDETTTITSINITLAGSATTGNISAVEIKNLTGSVLGSNTTWNTTTNKTTIRLTNGLFVNASINYTIIVAFNISTTATSLKTVAANLNISDINTTSSADNITIGESNTSSASQIQDIRASATISPKYADTSVINQSFTYNLTIAGDDEINNTVITIPTGYTIVSLSSLTWISTSTTIYPTTPGIILLINTSDNKINITFASGAYATFGIPTKILINFTLNTSASAINSIAFNSTLSGANLTNVNTTIATGNATNVTTTPFFTVQSVNMIKAAALVNDTDYWEFNFTLNFTKNITTGGFLQFKMNNWNTTIGSSYYYLNLTNQTAYTNTTRYYASMRQSDNASRIFNITNDYNFMQGISLNLDTNTANIYFIVLKMLIPSGTPVSSNWWTTYNTLFRSSP